MHECIQFLIWEILKMFFFISIISKVNILSAVLYCCFIKLKRVGKICMFKNVLLVLSEIFRVVVLSLDCFVLGWVFSVHRGAH